MADWRTTTLDQLGRIVTGKTPRSNVQGYFDGDIPFVTPSDMDGRRIIKETSRYLTENGANATGRSRIPKNAVMVSCIGSDMGKAAVTDRESVTNQQINSIVAGEAVDPMYVYYDLSRRKDEIRLSAGGSAQPILNKSAFGQMTIRLPPVEVQRAIASVLGALDDKIEQNRRTAQALEKLARAIFRAWFVDFEPVKAKAAGRTSFPSMPQPVFDALPARLVDSAIGPVPEGWRAGVLGDVFEIGLGGQWGSDGKTDKETYPARCLRGIDCHGLASGVRPDVPLRWLKPSLASRRELVDGVVLVEGSGSFCGRSFLWRNSFASLYEEDVLYSNFTKRLDPLEGVPNAVVSWYQMKDAYESDAVANFRTGSAFPNLDVKGMLNSFNVVIPDHQVALAFSELIGSFSDPCAIAENVKLAELRDYLLPKLLSGQIRVRAAERIAATVA